VPSTGCSAPDVASPGQTGEEHLLVSLCNVPQGLIRHLGQQGTLLAHSHLLATRAPKSSSIELLSSRVVQLSTVSSMKCGPIALNPNRNLSSSHRLGISVYEREREEGAGFFPTELQFVFFELLLVSSLY